jgi:CheY-like chemotaxis protein
MSKKIMIVDDEENFLELMINLLQNQGFEVIPAENGRQCLDRLREVKPDLILMDMMMPGMSGKETTQKIREDPRTKDIKIIFLTVVRLSYIGEDILKELEVSEYIVKPFDNDDLIQRIKKVLEE